MFHLVVFRRLRCRGRYIVDLIFAEFGVGQGGAEPQAFCPVNRPASSGADGTSASAGSRAGCRTAAPRQRLQGFQQPPAPSAMTKPSRSLEKGLEAFGGSLWVDNAERSEKRISASAVAEPSVPIVSARVVRPSPDRFDTELDGGGARGTGRRESDRQAPCAEAVGEPLGNGAEVRCVWKATSVRFARGETTLVAVFRMIGQRCAVGNVERNGRSIRVRSAGAARNSGPSKSPDKTRFRHRLLRRGFGRSKA